MKYLTLGKSCGTHELHTYWRLFTSWNNLEFDFFLWKPYTEQIRGLRKISHSPFNLVYFSFCSTFCTFYLSNLCPKHCKRCCRANNSILVFKNLVKISKTFWEIFVERKNHFNWLTETGQTCCHPYVRRYQRKWWYINVFYKKLCFVRLSSEHRGNLVRNSCASNRKFIEMDLLFSRIPSYFIHISLINHRKKSQLKGGVAYKNLLVTGLLSLSGGLSTESRIVKFPFYLWKFGVVILKSDLNVLDEYYCYGQSSSAIGIIMF